MFPSNSRMEIAMRVLLIAVVLLNSLAPSTSVSASYEQVLLSATTAPLSGDETTLQCVDAWWPTYGYTCEDFGNKLHIRLTYSSPSDYQPEISVRWKLPQWMIDNHTLYHFDLTSVVGFGTAQTGHPYVHSYNWHTQYLQPTTYNNWQGVSFGPSTTSPEQDDLNLRELFYGPGLQHEFHVKI